jgi:hypothetical protein
MSGDVIIWCQTNQINQEAYRTTSKAMPKSAYIALHLSSSLSWSSIALLAKIFEHSGFITTCIIIISSFCKARLPAAVQ